MPSTFYRPNSCDELIITLENDAAFYRAYTESAQQLVASFFRTQTSGLGRGRNVQCHIPNVTQAMFADREPSLIKRALQPLVEQTMQRLRMEAPVEDVGGLTAVLAYFCDRLVREIQSGAITFSARHAAVFDALYRQQLSIAATCRLLSLTRHQVNEIRQDLLPDDYSRYLRVQQGERYAHVMNDCDGFIHDHPRFDPVFQERGNDLCEDIEPGDLVAPWGNTEQWFVATNRPGKGGIVNTNMPASARFEHQYVTRPCRVLKQAYICQLSRVGGQIMQATA